MRHWIDWNYTGLEAKELWPAFRELTTACAAASAIRAWPSSTAPVHERAGSIRMYETLPFFSGRSTLEGVYNQASLTTHAVYYLASELGATSPNPFEAGVLALRPRRGLDHLRLFNVSDVVALSTAARGRARARTDVVREARIPPYSVFRLADPGQGYVEPLAFAPVRSPRGLARQGVALVHAAAHRAASSSPTTRAWASCRPTPGRPRPAAAAGGVEVTETFEAEPIRITTNRPGHPLLVKVAWHPRWRAEGASGPTSSRPRSC